MFLCLSANVGRLDRLTSWTLRKKRPAIAAAPRQLSYLETLSKPQPHLCSYRHHMSIAKHVQHHGELIFVCYE